MKRRLTIIASAAVLAVSAVMADVDLDNGLVTWFSFDSVDSNGKVENRADANKPLTLVSDATLDAAEAVSGSSLSFPGAYNQSATFITPPLTNCTVAFWVRRGEDDGPYVITNSVSLPYLFAGWSAIRCHCAHANRSISFIGNNNKAVLTKQDVVTPTVWMHCVFTLSEIERVEGNSTVETKLYVGGHLYAIETNTVAGVQGGAKDNTTWIGNFNDGTRPPKFKIDEFRAWNRAITAEEAFAEYDRTADGMAASLIAYWNMDGIENDSGTPIVPDGTALGHTLTIGTAVTVTNDAVEGSALAFTADSASWGRADFYLPLSDFTFTAWLKQDPQSTSPSPRIIDGRGGYVHVLPDRYSYGLTVKDPRATSAFSFSGANQPWCVDKGLWTHLAIVRKVRRLGEDSYVADITMYVNGERKAGETGVAISNPFLETGNNIHYNFFSNGGSRPFEGLGDEVRCYAGALSADRIAKIYAGAPAVSAGNDFTVAVDSAVLRGSIGTDAGDGMRAGYSGDSVEWSIVSAPEGGEDAVFASPASPVTEVTLPAAGEYVFRLSVASEGLVRSNDVTVVRSISAAGSAPSVTASAQATVVLPLKGWLKATASGAERVWWSKASGPGGVWFDVDGDGCGYAFFSAAGSYTLTCHAGNEAGETVSQVAVTVQAGETVDIPSDNLELHYAFNTNKVWLESAKGYDCQSQIIQTGGSVVDLVPGVKGQGFRVRGSSGSLSLDGNSTWEMRDAAQSNVITNPPYLTFSAWMKYEPNTDINGSELPFIFIRHQSACLRMGRPAGTAISGFRDGGDGMMLSQQGKSGQHVGLLCDFDGIPSVTGRWTHVCAVLPRTSGEKDEFALYIDGVKRTLTAHGSYASFPRPARDQRNSWELGGRGGNTITSNFGLFAHATNSVASGYRSATFPGTLDEVRFYSARLTDAQIRALANEMDASRNFAPAIDTPVPLRVKRGADMPLSLGVYDDGKPATGALSCSWKVLSGDEAAVSFEDDMSSSTTVRFKAIGNYKLQLVATDGERTSYSDPVDVEVQPIGIVINFR